MRKSKSMLLISWSLAIAVCALSCKPTPTKPIVQSKANDSVAKAIKDSADGKKYTYAAPGTYQSQAKDETKKITINVDAKVNVPTDTWGLYALKPIDPTYEDVKTMLDAIVGNATIYGQQTLKSKEYWMQRACTDYNI